MTLAKKITKQYPYYQVLTDSFNQILQAIVTPEANLHVADYLNDFIVRQ